MIAFRPVRLTLTVTAGALAVAAATMATPAQAGGSTSRCAAKTDKSIRGSLVGADGKGVNALIGFDVTDAQGRKINLATGCPVVTYGGRVELNPGVAAGGAKLGSHGPNGVVSSHFKISGLPANARTLYAEVYMHDAHGVDNHSRYGWTVRQRVPIGPAGVTLRLVAPLRSATGQIKVILNRPANQVLAFSQDQDGKTTSPGWAFGVPADGSGRTFLLPALAGGQPYVVDIDGTHLVPSVRVSRGKTTTIHVTI